MYVAMKLPKILCGSALGISGVLGVVFLIDLIVKIPFNRANWATDVVVLLACGLIFWQALETWFEL